MSKSFFLNLLFLMLVFFPTKSLCQQLKKETILQQAIKEQCIKYDNSENFKKVKTFFLKEEWDSTLVYVQKQLNEQPKEQELLDYCHLFRGISLSRKQIYDEALKELSFISKNFIFNNLTTMIKGEIALKKDDPAKALKIYKELINFENQDLLGVDLLFIKQNIAVCHLLLKQYEKAEITFLEILQAYENKKDTVKIYSSQTNLANLYYSQYKDEMAIPYFQNAYKLSKKINDFEIKQNAVKNMAVVEENRKNLKAALTYRKQFDQWKDSLNNQNKILETAQKIAKIEKEYAVKQKQQEVNLLKVENKAKVAQRNGFIYAVIGLLLLLSTITFFYRKNIKTKKIILAQKEQLDVLNATKDKLFSIVSHDLRSSVNTLKLSNKKLISNLKAENIPAVYKLLQQNSALVGSAYNLLDNLLNWALLQTKQSYFEMKEIQLFFAMEHVTFNYIPLIKEQQLLFESKILKSDKVFADQESLKIILRNLIDNAIKFSKAGGAIKIYTQHSKEGFLDIVIEDSGIGMNKKTLLQLQKETFSVSEKENKEIIGSGLGLQLCKSMIKKNKGTLTIDSELEKGTKMIVSLLKPLPHGQR